VIREANKAKKDKLEKAKKAAKKKRKREEAATAAGVAGEPAAKVAKKEFKWKKSILKVLKKNDNSMKIKELRKAIMADYVKKSGSGESKDELKALFVAKLGGVSGVALTDKVASVSK